MEQKKEIASRIKGLVQRNIESGLSGESQGGSGKSSANGLNGSSSGKSGFAQGRQANGVNGGGLSNRLVQNTRAKAQDVKNRVGERVRNSDAYGKISKIQEDASRAKQEARMKAQEKINKLGGETGKQISKFSASANALRKKMEARKKALKKALNTQAKKSHASGSVVAIVFIVTLVLAIVVDGLDILGEVLVELGTVPTIIAYIINFCSSIIISAAWFAVFSGHTGKNSRQTKVIIRSILILFGLENIPVIELLPFNAISVILNYVDYKAGQKEEQQ